MSIILKDTTAARISSAILKARRNVGAASGLVFTLVVVTDSKHLDEVMPAAMESAREHPSRIVVVCTGRGRTSRLDAEIRAGEGVPSEVITLYFSGEVGKHADSVVLPLLLPDSPVVVWWPFVSPERPGDDPIGELATRRITDASGSPDPLAALRVRANHLMPGDTDLTWTRLTPWRALLAAGLDQYHGRIQSATVDAAPDNAPAELMAAWLEVRLGVEVNIEHTEGPGITGVRLHSAAGDVSVMRPSAESVATYQVPGQPPRSVALRRRQINQLITEELRRVDADDIFQQAIHQLLVRYRRNGKTRKTNKVAVHPHDSKGEA